MIKGKIDEKLTKMYLKKTLEMIQKEKK